MADFSGKTVLVTGSGGGLGKAIAEAYLSKGAQVVLCDINEARLKEADTELSAKGTVFAQTVDITNEESVKSLVQAAVDKFGRIDILVNNAGIADKFSPIGTVDTAIFERVLKVNVTGTMLMSKHTITHMLAQSPPGGSIVNIGSVASIRGFVAGAAYTASKHAVTGLTRNTALYYGPKGIRCNQVQPGGMATNITESMMEGMDVEAFGRVSAILPEMYTGEESLIPVAEVADMVLVFSGPGAGSVNGQCVSVDRGVSSAV